jgi:hypothetical protein
LRKLQSGDLATYMLPWTGCVLLSCFMFEAHGSHCTGTESSRLALTQCAGWQAFFDGAGAGQGWWSCSSAREDPCNCGSISCQGPDITHIYLRDSGLYGTIAPSLANLTGLSELNLANNALHGRVPDLEWSRLLVYGFCDIGGSNSFCTPLPAGAARCNGGGPVPIATNGSCARPAQT